MKKISIIILILILAIGIGFIPTRFTVKKNDINPVKNYIIVFRGKTTLSEWIAVGDNTGDYGDNWVYVRFKGKEPGGKEYEFDNAEFENRYICYGNYIGKGTLGNEEYSIFQMTDWDVLYPFHRNPEIPFAKGFICLYDYIFGYHRYGTV